MDAPSTRVPLRVLFVEDSDDDARLVEHQLRRSGYQVISRRVETADELTHALKNDWDIVISDFNLPRFQGDEALQIVRASKGPDLPFIVVSGTIGEEKAVALLKGGANDFVVKSRLARLVPAIERELKDAQVRRERREAIEGMRRAIEVRDEFLSIASHELKTPVTSLLLQLEMLRRRLPAGEVAIESGEDGESKIDMILRMTHRLTELINRLLDISRVTSGKLRIQPSKTDFCPLVTESIQRVLKETAKPRPEVRVKAPSSLVGDWDPGRIQTVVVNLVTNAVKYGDGEPIDVTLEELGQDVRLTVRDYGIGIAPDDQARIFERFERAVSSRHFGGFGLGLWLSRQIIEAHGGSIQVQSEPGKGSTFEVKLPRHQ